jgi:octaprenyl-diphosphate synthase
MTQSVHRLEPAAPSDVLARLRDVCHERGTADLAARLAELRAWIASDLAEVEGDLRRLDGGDTPAYRSAHHLLLLEGKRLRPLCVLVATRLGAGPSPAARDLAVAAELVHSATLLHDDVVDVGDKRRGADTARVVYGNAASIFGGDWLLVEAISLIRRTGLSDVLDQALDVLREMLFAESFQLANRGRFHASARDYFQIAEGKTASLFRWAMFAGARVGGLPEAACRSLAAFGQKLGVAFQIVDDVLDVSGDPEIVGKSLLTDLFEGKMTYPLLVALERDASFEALLREASEADGVSDDVRGRVARCLAQTGAADEALAVARRYAAEGIERLSEVPAGRGRDALESIALGVVRRKR